MRDRIGSSSLVLQPAWHLVRAWPPHSCGARLPKRSRPHRHKSGSRLTRRRCPAPIPWRFLPTAGASRSRRSCASNGPAMLFVRRTGSLDSQPVPGTEDVSTAVDFVPFWSPDSQSLGFHAPASGKLKAVDVAGGHLRVLCDLPSTLFQGGAWNQHNDIVFSSDGQALSGACVRRNARARRDVIALLYKSGSDGRSSCQMAAGIFIRPRAPNPLLGPSG